MVGGCAYVGNVIPGKKDLSNRLVQVTKQAVPEGNETALSNSGQGLSSRKKSVWREQRDLFASAGVFRT